MSGKATEKLEPKRGAIALCSMGSLGLILSDKPEKITYDDGKTAEAWTGVYLTGRTIDWKFGPKKGETQEIPALSPWSSTRPRVICYVKDLIDLSQNPIALQEMVNQMNGPDDEKSRLLREKLYRGYSFCISNKEKETL